MSKCRLMLNGVVGRLAVCLTVRLAVWLAVHLIVQLTVPVAIRSVNPAVYPTVHSTVRHPSSTKRITLLSCQQLLFAVMDAIRIFAQ